MTSVCCVIFEQLLIVAFRDVLKENYCLPPLAFWGLLIRLRERECVYLCCENKAAVCNVGIPSTANKQ